MSIEDYLVAFDSSVYSWDPTHWHHSYWMALGNGDQIGTAGTDIDCGATCMQTKFLITSPIAQPIFISVHTHSKRQYGEAPCD